MRETIKDEDLKKSLFDAGVLLAEYACALDVDAKNDQKIDLIIQVRKEIVLMNKNYTVSAA